jgi:hypothetical protein
VQECIHAGKGLPAHPLGQGCGFLPTVGAQRETLPYGSIAGSKLQIYPFAVASSWDYYTKTDVKLRNNGVLPAQQEGVVNICRSLLHACVSIAASECSMHAPVALDVQTELLARRAIACRLDQSA